MPILVTRRAEEEHERPSLCAELTMLLTSPDAYIAALALLVGFLTPEALPQHQRGAPLNSSGLLSNVYLDDSEQACPHAHAMHTPCTRHATPSARHAHAATDDASQACPMWLLLTLCFSVPCAVGLALAVLSPARGTPHRAQTKD